MNIKQQLRKIKLDSIKEKEDWVNLWIKMGGWNKHIKLWEIKEMIMQGLFLIGKENLE